MIPWPCWRVFSKLGGLTRFPAPLLPAPRTRRGAGDVRAENARTGYPGWRITSPGQPHEIEGYTDHASARPGVSGH